MIPNGAWVRTCNCLGNRCASVGNSRRPCKGSETAATNQGFAKIISLVDTVRYRNWPRRLILYIYALWADSLESSGACNGHVDRHHLMLDDSPIGLVPVDNRAPSTEYCIEQRVDERAGDNIARHQQAGTFAFFIDRRTFRRKFVTGAGDLWFPAIRWLRGGGVRSRGRPRL